MNDLISLNLEESVTIHDTSFADGWMSMGESFHRDALSTEANVRAVLSRAESQKWPEEALCYVHRAIRLNVASGDLIDCMIDYVEEVIGKEPFWLNPEFVRDKRRLDEYKEEKGLTSEDVLFICFSHFICSSHYELSDDFKSWEYETYYSIRDVSDCGGMLRDWRGVDSSQWDWLPDANRYVRLTRVRHTGLVLSNQEFRDVWVEGGEVLMSVKTGNQKKK